MKTFPWVVYLNQDINKAPKPQMIDDSILLDYRRFSFLELLTFWVGQLFIVRDYPCILASTHQIPVTLQCAGAGVGWQDHLHPLLLRNTDLYIPSTTYSYFHNLFIGETRSFILWSLSNLMPYVFSHIFISGVSRKRPYLCDSSIFTQKQFLRIQ